MARATDVESPAQRSVDELFDEIFYEYFRQCVVFFARRGLEREEASDLAQQTMLQVYVGIDGFQSRSSLRTWILRIALNVWNNWCRDRRTQKRLAVTESLDQVRDAGHDVAESDNVWNAGQRNPETESIESQAKELILQALPRLSPRQRECMELWLQGLKYREIADRLGISVQTVKTSIHRGKAGVRQLLQPSDGELESDPLQENPE